MTEEAEVEETDPVQIVLAFTRHRVQVCQPGESRREIHWDWASPRLDARASEGRSERAVERSQESVSDFCVTSERVSSEIWGDFWRLYENLYC